MWVDSDVLSAAYVALLRGINVGGKNTLPMSDLRDLFTTAGCRDVQTYIQSGNVVFRADRAAVAPLPGVICASIAERYGLRVPVIVRSAARMAEIVGHNPFLAADAATNALHVLFLAEPPRADTIARLDRERSLPDRFVVRGEEIYLHLPNGAGRTKLTNTYFDTALGTTSTGRNWRTVTKLFALLTR